MAKKESATKGNQFWKLRAKHGRDKLFASPELLWEAACEYFEWVTNNPEYQTKPMSVSGGMNVGSEIEMIEIPVKQPFTLHGLCIYLDCGTAYFRNFKNEDRKGGEDFKSVIAQIEEVIYNQKFSGAASGFFNANIIARDLGLRDQQDVNVNDNRKNVEELFPDEEEFNKANG